MVRLGGIFDFDSKQERLIEVERELEQPDVWNEPERAQALGRERAELEQVVVNLKNLQEQLQDAEELLELAVEEGDKDSIDEIESDLLSQEKDVEALEFRRMFSGDMDANSAFVDIQAGSGGTEAQDWAEMLLRQYERRSSPD